MMIGCNQNKLAGEKLAVGRIGEWGKNGCVMRSEFSGPNQPGGKETSTWLVIGTRQHDLCLL